MPRSPEMLPTSTTLDLKSPRPYGPYLLLVQGQDLPVVLLKFQARRGRELGGFGAKRAEAWRSAVGAETITS